MEAGATMGTIEGEVAFMRTTLRRRDVILDLCRKEGLKVEYPYTFDIKLVEP